MYRPKLVVVVNNTRKKNQISQMWERLEKKWEAQKLSKHTLLLNENTQHPRFNDISIVG